MNAREARVVLALAPIVDDRLEVLRFARGPAAEFALDAGQWAVWRDMKDRARQMVDLEERRNAALAIAGKVDR